MFPSILSRTFDFYHNQILINAKTEALGDFESLLVSTRNTGSKWKRRLSIRKPESTYVCCLFQKNSRVLLLGCSDMRSDYVYRRLKFLEETRNITKNFDDCWMLGFLNVQLFQKILSIAKNRVTELMELAYWFRSGKCKMLYQMQSINCSFQSFNNWHNIFATDNCVQTFFNQLCYYFVAKRYSARLYFWMTKQKMSTVQRKGILVNSSAIFDTWAVMFYYYSETMWWVCFFLRMFDWLELSVILRLVSQNKIFGKNM